MKKIAFIVWDLTILGGVNQVTVTLVNEFCKKYEVFVVSLIKGNGQAQHSFDQRVNDIRYIVDQEGRGRDVVFKGKRQLRAFLSEKNIDVVFLMGFQVALPAILMMGRKKCKYVFCEHEALLSRWRERKITLVRYLAALLSDKIVTLTEQNARDYRKKFHFKASKVLYIYNSISDKVIQNRVKEYNRTSRTILSVGRFGNEKGYDLLVDIAAQVLPGYPEWSWHIYGNGEMFAKIKKKIEEKELQEKVILEGEVNDVSAIYGQGAMFVLTSRREGLPLVLLEAKANYLPCVSFDIISGPKEIIRNRIDGFLIEPFDVKAMAEAIERLMRDDNLRCEMAMRADENLAKFSTEKVMENWDHLIASL